MDDAREETWGEDTVAIGHRPDDKEAPPTRPVSFPPRKRAYRPRARHLALAALLIGALATGVALGQAGAGGQDVITKTVPGAPSQVAIDRIERRARLRQARAVGRAREKARAESRLAMARLEKGKRCSDSASDKAAEQISEPAPASQVEVTPVPEAAPPPEVSAPVAEPPASPTPPGVEFGL